MWKLSGESIYPVYVLHVGIFHGSFLFCFFKESPYTYVHAVLWFLVPAFFPSKFSQFCYPAVMLFLTTPAESELFLLDTCSVCLTSSFHM